MRHKLGYRKLNRPTDQRLAMLRSQSIALIKHGRIKTTVTRAKELRRTIEKLITVSRKGDLFSKRKLFAALRNKEAVKLLGAMQDKFEGRAGGYTRITRIGTRRGDAVELAQIEIL